MRRGFICLILQSPISGDYPIKLPWQRRGPGGLYGEDLLAFICKELSQETIQLNYRGKGKAQEAHEPRIY